MGFLGKNPESKSTKNTGRTLASLSLATKTWWTGKDEERKEKTEWHRIIVIWNQSCLSNVMARRRTIR
jgi:single-strand DNA-binding protein